ncbi:hypothetical protein J6590_070590 [Homalodisca vitripennis]|nr:hypothetical protein J6590_070588 [Homalodisca vitripennis]KAG8330100.1 hypothetical protein J6590_070590 [Homalodisca vitripennis]
MTVNSQIIVKRPVGGKIDLILELTKCRMKEEPDTCEFNSRHRVVLDCQQLHDQNKMWSEFVQHITNLSDQCPVSPGEYNMTDAPVSLRNMDRLPLGFGYWKISANGIIKKKLIFCIVAELNIEIQRIRKHKY